MSDRSTAVVGSYHRHETFVRVDLKAGDVRGLWHRTMNLLAAYGFKVEVPAETLRNYRCLAPTTRGGIYKGLEFESRQHGHWETGGNFQIEFFQNLVFENRNGGKYDFGKLEKMPYLVRLRFWHVWDKLQAFWKSLGIVDGSRPNVSELSALDRVRYEIVVGCEWHFTGGDPLVDWRPTSTYNGRDRDGKQIEPGQVKWFYTYRGHLMRGTAYYGLNNMWYVVLNARCVERVSGYQLFDFTPGTPRRRPLETKKVVEKLQAAEKIAVSKREYERAAALRDVLEELEVPF